jgi:hypothetical protein
MKEIKASWRDTVVRGLEETGCDDMTVDDLRALRRGVQVQVRCQPPPT